MTEEIARLERIFTEALARTRATDRVSFLDQACSGDIDLRQRVEALLDAHADAGSFLSLPDEVTVVYEPLHERPGATIGRYTLLEQIGEGGFGVVFMAEQERPVRRRVALKVIKSGMDTKQFVARFEAERQALAMMDHPNIAKVLDAGATDTGRPYFVMELVRGTPITDYCDEARLATDERLGLFCQVCAAVQHAHQKGVIHRDLKPSNVLVTLYDDKAVPKVIDFGVAKATQGRLTEHTLFTEFRQLVGTPSYMSPEQALMSGLDVDTRSDIYSLGVLLYELLTGATPIDSRRVCSATFDELRRLICEEEPPRPSTRLSSLSQDQRTALARQRHCEPTHLAVGLRNDLDWIVMRCLEKDRTRRYPTANSLALDVQHYLACEPVEARRPTRGYRLSKLVRRNWLIASALSTATTTLVAATGLATWMFFQQAEATRRAVAAELRESSLRQEAELQGNTAKSILLCVQGKPEEADAMIVNQQVPYQPGKDVAEVYRMVGDWHARDERFAIAAERFRTLVYLNEFDSWDAVSLDYCRFAAALVELCDVESYEEMRLELITRFGGTRDVVAAERIIKACTLLPPKKETLKLLIPIMETAQQSPTPWSYTSFALFDYRRGDYSQAIDWCEQALNGGPFYGDVPRNTQARVLLALSAHQLGKHRLANSSVFEAQQVIDDQYRTGLGHFFWFDWSISRILLAEANKSLQIAPAGRR